MVLFLSLAVSSPSEYQHERDRRSIRIECRCDSRVSFFAFDFSIVLFSFPPRTLLRNTLGKRSFATRRAVFGGPKWANHGRFLRHSAGGCLFEDFCFLVRRS